MSWTDKVAVEEVLKLRDEFNIKTAIATGTFRGIDVELYAHHFDEVLSMDIEPEYLGIARERLGKYKNVELFLMPSWEFLSIFVKQYCEQGRDDYIFIYLDAHFFDPDFQDRWVVVKELKALKGFKEAILCLHDFDCQGLGHLIYGGEHLGRSVVGEHIQQVNPDFCYYTNKRDYCDIYNEETVRELPITVDEYVIDSIRFANSSDIKRYRGILYATPRKLDLDKFRLVEYGISS